MVAPVERKIWFLKHRVDGDTPAEPLPPGAGGELATWNLTESWHRCGPTAARHGAVGTGHTTHSAHVQSVSEYSVV